jgi:hypothetical protein
MIVRRLLAVLVVGAALVAAFAYVDSTEPAWYVRLRYPLHYDAIVRGHARNYRLDPALVAAVIYQESKFHVHARSSSGAIGLMQLLPATAEGIAIHTGGTRFQVNVIPHTFEVTNFSELKQGDRVNIEIDTIARYVERITSAQTR